MNEIIQKENIEDMIYEIRGVQVMLDSDLAKLYNCTNGTKDINKAVKRNINKFPLDFYFQLTKEETDIICLRFQSGTLNNKGNLRGQHLKYMPYVFTEQGVAMLASVLHTKVAEEVSVIIMRSFVKMRKMLINNNDLHKKIFFIEDKIIEHDIKLRQIKESFEKLEENELKNNIFFKGQTYDAYSLLLDILNKSKKEIIIIDNYIDKKILDVITNIKVNVVIVSKNMNNELIKKYQSQYNNLIIKQSDEYHDRFIIIDKKELYHLGSSLKDLGKGCFCISKIEDLNYINLLLNKIHFL